MAGKEVTQPAPPTTNSVVDVDPSQPPEPQIGEDVIAFVDAVLEDDAVWPRLLELLNETPDGGTMDEVRDRVYRLFDLMHKAGLWGDPETVRLMALHSHYDVSHLSDLRKSSLNRFAVMSFDAAQAKVGDEVDDG